MIIDTLKSVLGLIATIIGIIVGILTIYRIFRKKEIFRPNLRLAIGWMADFPKTVPKRARKKLPSVFVFVPKQRIIHPLIISLDIGLDVPPDKEAIKNVRIMLEYKKQYLIDNDLLEAITQFEPTFVHTEDTPDSVHYMQSELKAGDIKKHLEKREISIIGKKVQITYEFPIIRPGDGNVYQEFLLLPGIGPDNFEGLDNCNLGGFDKILSRLKEIKNLKDYFAVNIWVNSENHPSIRSKVAILQLANEKEMMEDLAKFIKSFWFGQSLKPGLYFNDHIASWILRKLKVFNRLSHDFFKNELGIIALSNIAKIKTSNGKTFAAQIPEISKYQFFSLGTPNCDYYDLPDHVDNFNALMIWMGLPNEPLIPHLAEKEENRREGSDDNVP